MAQIYSAEFAARFWASVLKTDSCWLWNGSVNSRGYGQVTVPGRDVVRSGFRTTTCVAHRVSWELTFGELIPVGLQALHNCLDGDNPQCVNPAHLWLGTQSQNIRDADSKGRRKMRHGVGHHSAKLNDEAVQEIRRRYADGGVSQKALAEEFEVNRKTVWDIIYERHWKHVPAVVCA